MGSFSQRSGRATGRRNISIACENCRARKVRCDGSRPACKGCVQRNYNCKYTVSLAPWDRSRQRYVEDLEKKLGVRRSISTSSQHEVSASSANALSQLHLVESRRATSRHAPAQLPVVDYDFQGNECLETTPNSNRPSPLNGSVHVGHSSTGVFLRHLNNSAAPPPDQSTRAFSLGDLGMHTPMHEMASTQCVLPSRERANELLTHYWEMHHPIYPAVSRSEFLQDLEAIYAGMAPTDTHQMTYCLANFIFALAGRSIADTSPREKCHDYFETGKQMLHFDMFGNFSFPLLQALVLSAQYLQSTEKPRQCWAIVGFGITVAQSMGLHLSGSIGNMSPGSDRRLALSVWNCLVTLDRTLSMTLGRSPRIGLSVAKASTAFSQQNTHNSDDLILFNQSCRLFDVLHEILDLLYNEGPELAPVIDIIRHSARLEKELDRWVRELPQQLRHEEAKSSSHASFLRQRYLQVRIILMRPGLLQAVRNSAVGEWNLEQSITWYCANQSVEAAIEMSEISTAHLTLNTIPWWYRLQYSYNAGVTLLAARLSRRLVEGSHIQQLDAGISNCARSMEACGLASVTASRCLSLFLSVAEKLGHEAPSVVNNETQLEGEVQSREPISPALPWDDIWAPLWTETVSSAFPDQPWDDLLSFI